ncbi:putative exosome complex exonuclease rrp4 [Kockovaella imperatae]|uniref:Exosome complex component RRP4 n=1 Tax=Kockovaella imperatae TaxID=4999 RepID=A0A1Y1UFN5_9TREE|nr:putative exosome complex exonuclease rrp4 [Kockovaella imperatae]ORX36871.1 putative exosome complex exonuclease rrp4 [Kockovaella imperatae]
MDIDQQGDLGEGSSTNRGIVSPGEIITSSKEYMRGHGTYVDEEQVVSSLSGTIERVNKLVSVKALKQRYTPEVGDLVIGRIVEVGSMRWRVDANARQDAVLMLSSVNLPGGVQRRKIESDALKMREFLAEGDLLVAEVQAFFGDGAMSLHTRSLKYGKLRNGQLLSVSPRLIRRLKSHFHHIPPPCGPSGVDIILGLNGLIWVSVGTSVESREGGEGFDAEGVYSNKNDDITPEGRQAISSIASIIKILAMYNIPLSDILISSAYEWLSSQREDDEDGISAEMGKRMVEDLTGVQVTAAA